MLDFRFIFCLVTIVLCCTFGKINAQPIADGIFEFQGVYRVTFQTDSLNKGSRDSTDMLLLLNKSNSLFADVNTILRDTLMYYRHKNNITPILSIKEIRSNGQKLRYYITKNENGNVRTNDWGSGMDFAMYQYEENTSVFDWILSEQTDSINGIACQKATCYFGKRHWTAWFAPSIPISDGPYKFAGLPGLIIKITDDKNYWSFVLQKMVSQSFSYHFYSIDPLNYKVKHISKYEFLKNRRNYIDNMYMLQKQAGVTFKDGDRAGKKMAERMAKVSNNWIEIFP